MKDVLKDKLRVIADDNFMLEALHIIIGSKVESLKPEESDDDEVLGQKYRAYLKAKKILSESLKDIESYKSTKVEITNYNKGK